MDANKHVKLKLIHQEQRQFAAQLLANITLQDWIVFVVFEYLRMESFIPCAWRLIYAKKKKQDNSFGTPSAYWIPKQNKDAKKKLSRSMCWRNCDFRANLYVNVFPETSAFAHVYCRPHFLQNNVSYFFKNIFCIVNTFRSKFHMF